VNPPPASAQAHYQVRLDWGQEGAHRIQGEANLCVWVDALVTAPRPEIAVGDASATDFSNNFISANLTNRTAVAQWILSEQVRRGERTSIAIVAVGTDAGGFAVEDFLAAGALIDALASVGIDFCSPEAADSAAAFVGLKGAVGHLVTASVMGRELIGQGKRDMVVAAGKIDSASNFSVNES